ncbi:MAG: IS110 family transposase [Candidatus Helarchaeota archaeon]|nr:IS110 family transposase [Candidatus Helarchaeota archaeon]
MNYTGIDLHKNFSQIHICDEQMKECSIRLNNDETLIRNFFEPLKNNCKVAVEATGNWYWLVDLLQGMDIDVLLANPLQTKAIAYARVKNDPVDAKTLTHLLRTDLLPTCWIPEREQRNNRDMLRARVTLVGIRTLCKNIVRGTLNKFNIKLPFSNIWAGAGRAALEKVSLSIPYCEFINHLLVHIEHLTPQIDYWEKKIHEQIPLAEDAHRLLTVPGIGDIWALTIFYETGPIERFPRAKRYVSYAGLVPKTRGTSDKYWNGHLCKQANMYLKCAYIEVATAALRSRDTDRRMVSYYHRVMKRKGKSVAKVAVARKIATVVYHMLKEKIDYATCMERNKMAG